MGNSKHPIRQGFVFKDLGDYGQVFKLFQMAYDAFKSALGEQHPNTKTVKRWLDRMA